ncbi:hypothetical protein N7G274_004050 [Stereocaulon virgatum]|uniref:Wax synthase domain-containing protein n=1 Tax=Stereocaulon virgatum TaxID=373712 RepID=A0ABR4AEI4_9LECA
MAFFSYLPTIPPPPRPDLKTLPGTTSLTPLAALAPPLIYYLALLLLPPFPSHSYQRAFAILRNTLAAASGFLFFRLPLAYHVPFSVGLTYQLALVGLYGGCRVLDAFFISPYLFGHIPRRVKYHHAPRTARPGPRRGASAESYFSLHFLKPGGEAVIETATTDEGWPHGWLDRMSWALELELSMRGAGFTWTSADVRHTRHTWRPSVRDRTHSILVHVLPVLLVSWAIILDIYTLRISHGETFDDLPYILQAVLTASLGAFLMSAFSLGHSGFAIMLAPLKPHPLSYFPPLYTARVWELKSVRGFWSYGWHRLFSRLFLVYGVWPGEWLERKLTGRKPGEEADVGKVLGGFVSSAFVHSFAAHTVMGGWNGAFGEAWFFAGNGLAVVIEEGVKTVVLRHRRKSKKQGKKEIGEEGGNSKGMERWYDGIVGRVWWICVLLYTGRNFARGWVIAGLVREMAGL